MTVVHHADTENGNGEPIGPLRLAAPAYGCGSVKNVVTDSGGAV